MKKTIYGILIITLVLMVSSLFAQNHTGFDTNINKSSKQIKQLDNNSIKVDIAIIVDNKAIEDSFKLTIINIHNKISTTIKVYNKFILYLDYNSEYEIQLTKPNCNTKIVYIDTDAPYDNWYVITGINLNSNNNTIVKAGGIRYNSKLQTFEKYKL